MRRLIAVLILTSACLNLGAGAALADGMVLPGPYALSPGYLAVRSHHVSAQIEDGHAVTRVDQEFYNPYDVAVTGQYFFPIPPDAILSSFEATVDGRAQLVARQDAAATNAALTPIIVEHGDPSLLQYAGWESLSFELSLPPGGSRRMSLRYEQVLAPAAGGLIHYRYVLGTERYSSQPLDEVSVVVDIRSASGLASVYSSTHAVGVERSGPGRARVTWEARGVRPAEDFDLFFAPAEGGQGAGFLTGRRNGDDHFLLLFSPDAAPDANPEAAKDIVFILDRSGSMQGEKIEQAQAALRFVLGALGSGDRFSIVGFDDQLSILSATLRPASGPALAGARRFVDGLTSRGSTDLAAALQAGLGILASSERRDVARLVVFLTDGLPTAGIQEEEAIAELAARANAGVEARLHVFGVGYDVNTHLLDGLAARNAGSVTYVQPGENLEAVLTGFYARIAHPVLTDVRVEFDGMAVRDLYPEALPDLFEGSSLMLAGRYQASGDAATVRVRGRAGGRPREFVYEFDLAQLAQHDRDFVPRLWATRRVGALLDRVRVTGETPALVEEVRGLGLAYGLVTPYTTFVIEGQAGGAASAQNMALYGRADLNQAWGQTTVQARVQNQAYQAAEQANLASGANVINSGRDSLAQIGSLSLDLSLLQQAGIKLPDGPIAGEWIAANVQADRTLTFGSGEYFALAADPEARPFLQSGANVVFRYQGQVVEVREPAGGQDAGAAPGESKQASPPGYPAGGPARRADAVENGSGGALTVPDGGLLGLGLVVGAALCAAAVVVIGRARRDRIRKV